MRDWTALLAIWLVIAAFCVWLRHRLEANVPPGERALLAAGGDPRWVQMNDHLRNAS